MFRIIFFGLAFLCVSQSHAGQIRNRYTHRVLIASNNNQVSVGIPGSDLSLTEWTHSLGSNDNATSEICARYMAPKKCLCVVANQIKLCPSASTNAQKWRRIAVPKTNYFRLQSLANNNAYIHNQGGSLTAGAIQPGWWSAMWAFDNEPVSDARSVHLSYQNAKGAKAFFLEVRVAESHPSTYFATIAFHGGYFGIQELGGYYCKSGSKSFNKQIIFSLWNEDGSPERNPSNAALASVVQKGTDVGERGFSGEGSGAQTYKCFPWEVNKRYQFYIRARVKGRYTHYRAYFRPASAKDWIFIAEAKRPTRGTLIDSVYSFVEDFGRTGKTQGIEADERTPFKRRAADFMNPWFKRPGGEWIAEREAKFTAWSENQPLTNISASTREHSKASVFRLETGGTVVQQTDLDTKIKSTSPPTTPPQKPVQKN